jgi:hypothetical protein
MPVELPIDPTLLAERLLHARRAALDVRDGDVHRVARRTDASYSTSRPRCATRSGSPEHSSSIVATA